MYAEPLGPQLAGLTEILAGAIRDPRDARALVDGNATGSGGAILSRESLTLNHVVIASSIASSRGGAVDAETPDTLRSSVRDLVALSTLPGLWIGRGVEDIVAGLVDVAVQLRLQEFDPAPQELVDALRTGEPIEAEVEPLRMRCRCDADRDSP